MELQTTIVGDGAQAWERLRIATEPTLAILDWMMPEMDGPTSAGAFARAAAREHVPAARDRAREPRRCRRRPRCRRRRLHHQAVRSGRAARAGRRRHPRARAAAEARRARRRAADRTVERQAAARPAADLQLLQAHPRRRPVPGSRWKGYIAAHSDAQFSHGICPSCYAAVSAELDEMARKRIAESD